MKRQGKSPKQRTLDHLRGSGWLAENVEVFVKPAGMKFGYTKDVCGLADIISFRPMTINAAGTADRWEMAFVQCCAKSGVASHKTKADQNAFLRPLLSSGVRFILVAWWPWNEDDGERRDEFVALEAGRTAQGGIAWLGAGI